MTCECVFCKLIFEGLKCRNEIYQRIELIASMKKKKKKNAVICLVTVFISRVMLIKMSKMAHFFLLLLLLFSADDSKKSVSGWVTYFSESESSYLILFENTMDYWLLSFYQQNVNS